MATCLSSTEWMDLMESTEAFNIILPPNPKQTRVVIILADCHMLFREQDFSEIIDTWRLISELSDY